MCVLTACGRPGSPAATSPTTSAGPQSLVNPARISRVREDLPPGYEVADLTGPVSPAAFWGFGAGWVTDPPQCRVLAGPDADDADGWSGSGPGGIVHAAVSGSPASPASPAGFDPGVLPECGQWTVVAGNTTGTVRLIDAPPIDGATTVGMDTDARTVVEGGTVTTSKAYTYSAYLDHYLVFITLVTDPGSPNPPLGQEFAADLLVKTVSALRG
ncbi:hypothetical protein DVS77_22510 [Mycolicibacterium moriokaense]|nr:hypothetical protein DVS77_22510 [Mycolicibacterium moriokaense]